MPEWKTRCDLNKRNFIIDILEKGGIGVNKGLNLKGRPGFLEVAILS